MSFRNTGLILAGAILSTAAATNAQVVINELKYDAPGSDNGNVFVELFGPGGTDISGWTVTSVEGSGASAGSCNTQAGQTYTFDPGTLIPADGFFVLADDDGTGATMIPNADVIANFDPENGADALVLLDDMGNLVDAVAYGPIDTSVVPGACTGGAWFEGTPARDVFAPLSIERCPAGTDTGDNDTDFTPNDPTPGVGSDRCGAIEWVNAGSGSSISVSAVGGGESVGLDIWMSESAGQPYLLLWSLTGPSGGGAVPITVDATTGIAAGFAGIPPFVGWIGVLDGNGRAVGVASMDWNGLGLTLPVAGPVPTWIGGVSLSPTVGLVGTNVAVQIDLEN